MSPALFELSREACVGLFAGYGVDIEPTPIEPGDSPTCCGVIGFVGDHIRGSLVLTASSEVLNRSGSGAGIPGPDWIGELANQLVGRIKNLLLQRGVEISFTVPIVIRGFALSPVPTESFDSTAVGAVRMWLDVVTGPAFRLGEPTSTGGLGEGSAVMF